MDKNQLTGIILLVAIFAGYVYFFSPDPKTIEATQIINQDTITQTDSFDSQKSEISSEVVVKTLKEAIDSTAQKEQIKRDIFQISSDALGDSVILENKDLQITFNTLGGSINRVLLKKFITHKKEPLVLLDKSSLQTQEFVETLKYGQVDLNTLYYEVEKKSNKVIFILTDDSTQAYIKRTYSLEEKGFKVSYKLEISGLESLIKDKAIYLSWKQKIKQLEKTSKQLAPNTTINYYLTEDGFDYLSKTANDEKTLGADLQWLSVKQKFFNTGILPEGKLENTVLKLQNNNIKDIVKEAEISTTVLEPEKGLNFYFGPNQYYVCKKIAKDYEKNVELGWVIFEPISLYLIMPIFSFLEKFFDNYGLIILILVFIVKSILFPLTYQSYKSMAKTRVLKPELDALKAKYGKDTQKIQKEQMKIYSKFGVNPLSGCIPVLAQAPIFLALFNFFPNAIQLRQKSFLWADDLSTFDSIATLPFDIPGYGMTVSLFTLLFTISQLVYTYYNNQMTPMNTSGPAFMKNMGYIFPVIMLFVFNTFSAGLTYYYFVSNMITIAQQLFIRRIVDEDKIREKLDSYKDKNPSGKKGKWQSRLQKMLQEQEETKRVQKQHKKKNK